MQCNINFSLLTAKIGFPESGKNTYKYETRGSPIYMMFSPDSFGVDNETDLICGYVPIREHIIMEVKVGKGIIVSALKLDQKYASRIGARIYHHKIEIHIKQFGKEDEGILQCLMTPDRYSRQVHLILTGECIHLLIYSFKCALAGFYKM